MGKFQVGDIIRLKHNPCGPLVGRVTVVKGDEFHFIVDKTQSAPYWSLDEYHDIFEDMYESATADTRAEADVVTEYYKAITE